jgi:V/A-type H+-transporting ATPase subunit I
MPVERVLVGAKSLSDLELRLEEVELKLDEIQFEREGLTRGLTIYERNMNRLEDMAARAKAAQLTNDSDPLFALQAWAPRERHEDLCEFADRNGLAIVIAEPSADDDPPTLLHNPSKWQVGESLVKFYMTPNYRLWDPSMVVLFSFALFFSMIISDAGYGVVMVAMLFIARKKLRGTAAGVLCSLLAFGTVVWGVLVGSYFGLSPSQGSFLAPLQILDLNDMDTMMLLSILIGAGHVILANAVTAWRQRSSPASLAPLGWIIAISGSLLLWLGGESLSAIGWGGLGAGLGFVFLFSGAGEKCGFLKRVGMGFMGLTRVTSAFGDILSYLRLFALGLASASLAVAFNDLAQTAREGLGGFGILIALVVLVVGHTLNFVLAIVSGFVHGLRLNLIEFFNWSVTEEGRPFEAFRKNENTP